MVNTAGTFCRCPVSYSVCGFLHALGLRRCQSTSGWVVFCLLCAKSTSKLYCTSRENMDISVYTAALPQSSLASNYSGNSLSFSNDTRLFLSFFLSELKCWEGRLEHLFMHLNYPSSLLPQILVCIQTGYRWQHFFGWEPTIILFSFCHCWWKCHEDTCHRAERGGVHVSSAYSRCLCNVPKLAVEYKIFVKGPQVYPWISYLSRFSEQSRRKSLTEKP